MKRENSTSNDHKGKGRIVEDSQYQNKMAIVLRRAIILLGENKSWSVSSHYFIRIRKRLKKGRNLLICIQRLNKELAY